MTTILARIMSEDLSYNEERKNAFHKKGKEVLRKVANILGLEKSAFTIRSNMSGIASSGEVILHSDTLYVSISQSMGKPNLLYRSCEGQKDYTGGRNQYMDVDSILTQSGLNKLRSCAKLN